MPKVFIIAEAGVNHNGSLKTAKRLVDAAAAAGCDAVKFQTFKTEDHVTVGAPKAQYQARNLRKGGTQFEMLKGLELSRKDHIVLFKYCPKKKILFMSTPYDEGSASFLNRLGMKVFKISSGDLTNKPLLEKVASFKKPVILSTGMSDMAEIKKAVRWIKKAWRGRSHRLELMHCVSAYPAKMKDMNLLALTTLKRRLKLPVGLSDHTVGIEAPIAAAALGASVIEKHFTLNRKMRGPDHKASLEPRELARMVQAVRDIGSALGDGIKRPTREEMKTRKLVRKSLVASRDIKAGTKIVLSDIAVKRPAGGIPPEMRNALVGRKARADTKKDRLLKWEYFSGAKKP